MIYLPLRKLTNDDKFAYWLQVRTQGDPASVAGEVRNALAAVDPNLPILEMTTITEKVDQFLENERLIFLLASAFSLLALTLASIGLYGV